MMTNKCTSFVGHFNGHAQAWVQYGGHHPMENAQDFAGSHWTPPSDDYLLRIAPAATWFPFKTMTMKKHTYYLAPK
jgi:hypothetical protein